MNFLVFSHMYQMMPSSRKALVFILLNIFIISIKVS